MRIFLVFEVIIITILFTSCKNAPLDVDISKIAIHFKRKRFDQTLFGTDFNQLEEANQDLYQEFGLFWTAYQETILRLGPAGDSTTLSIFQKMLKDPMVSEVETAINTVHNEQIEQYDKDFISAFKHYRYHFDDSISQIIYFNSVFNFGIYPTDSCLGVGLDFYLGRQHEITQKLPLEIFPRYMRNNMDSQYLVSDALKGWLMVKYQKEMDTKNLLTQIVYYGKIYYLLDACFPELSDSIKINYSSEKLNWAIENEEKIWRELAKDDILFETRTMEINKWTTDGPFTSVQNIPQSSPPKLGVWMGWQMVRSFMDQHPEVSLRELMQNKGYQDFLKSYRPN